MKTLSPRTCCGVIPASVPAPPNPAIAPLCGVTSGEKGLCGVTSLPVIPAKAGIRSEVAAGFHIAPLMRRSKAADSRASGMTEEKKVKRTDTATSILRLRRRYRPGPLGPELEVHDHAPQAPFPSFTWSVKFHAETNEGTLLHSHDCNHGIRAS